MMKLKFIFASIILFGSLLSCEKEIDVNIKDAAPVIVIEGIVNNDPDSQVVRISRSAPLGQRNIFPAVRGAKVTITEDGVRGAVFPETSAGNYVVKRIKGNPGHTYTLKVEIDGNVYIANSTMPQPVKIDTLALNRNTFFGEETRTISLEYQDPAGVKNYYRCLLTVNGVASNNFFLFDDNFSDGRKNSQELFDSDIDLFKGDIVEVELQCVDSLMYRYWQGLDQNESRGGASTTPANPVSNISNGALGYFSAYTKHKKVVRIP